METVIIQHSLSGDPSEKTMEGPTVVQGTAVASPYDHRPKQESAPQNEIRDPTGPGVGAKQVRYRERLNLPHVSPHLSSRPLPLQFPRKHVAVIPSLHSSSMETSLQLPLWLRCMDPTQFTPLSTTTNKHKMAMIIRDTYTQF